MKDVETAELNLIRDYQVTLNRLWRAVSEPVQLIQWFGPEGVYIEACDMDFTATGPWYCRMIGKDTGNVFKVSGQITSVQVPNNGAGHVGFTWAWHDEEDIRGPESHVTFTVQETGNGARLTLTHVKLDSVETAQAHTQGWTSTLRKLDVFVGTPATPNT